MFLLSKRRYLFCLIVEIQLFLFAHITYSQNGVGVNTSTPASTFEDNGSFGKKATTITGSITLDETYATLVCNNGSTAISVTLPTASTCAGRLYEIKRNSSSSANVTIVGTIDGATNLVLTLPNQSITVFSDGSNWLSRDGSSSYWSLTGNSGTSVVSNFIGTTDAVDFVLKTSNTERMRIVSGGSVGIGISTPSALLHIRQNLSGGATTPFIIQNGISGNPANTEVNMRLAPTDNEASFGADIGAINLGTNKIVLKFSTCDGTSVIERMRLDNNGYLGIGTTTPTSYLHVLGSFATKVTTLTASATLSEVHSSIVCNNGATAITIALPAASSSATAGIGNAGRIYNIKKNSSSTADVTISGTIDGVANLVLKGTSVATTLVSDGTAWYTLNGGQALNNSVWSLYGNSGSSATSNFIGSTDAVDLVLKTSNTERLRILSGGNVGVGASSPNSTFEINGSFGANVTSTSSNIILDATNYIVNITGGTPTVTLPAVAGCAKRIYHINNTTVSAVTSSSYNDLTNTAVTSIPANTGISIVSDGTTWRRFK